MSVTKWTKEQSEEIAKERREKIKNSADALDVSGVRYYVSCDGDDKNDGRTPESAWKTLLRVSEADLQAGDGVFFRRGDIFRGSIETKPNVSYGAFGVGEKPRLYGWDEDLASPELWELFDEQNGIWRYKNKILDCGTLVFDEGKSHSYKHIPSYINGRFVCRDDKDKPFIISEQLCSELDIYWHFEQTLTRKPSRGEDFPVPEVIDTYGELYLKCSKGNPGELFDSIEAVPRRAMFYVKENENVKIDNLCLKYIGIHAVAAWGNCVKGLRVTNCEIGWVGGTIQNYFGTDPNYPEGGRGTVTRYGNGVEIYGGCDDYEVSGCYIYQMYDAAITHQVSTFGKTFEMKNVRYLDNLVEFCVYSIEYFLDITQGGDDSFMRNIEIAGNILRHSGEGWGQQRHNKHTPAHIKGWSYTNTASEFEIHDNVFECAAYRMLHLVAKKKQSLPKMYRNTYIQYENGMLGQYGENEDAEPPIIAFDGDVDGVIHNTFGDEGALVYMLSEK